MYERLYMKKFDSIQGTLNAAQPSDCGVFSCCDFENFYHVFPRLALEHADIQDKLILPNLFFRLTSLSRKVFESLISTRPKFIITLEQMSVVSERPQFI